MGLTPVFIKLDTADDNAKTVFFTLNLVFGSFGALCLIGLSPILASIYGMKALIPLTIVFALSFVIGSMTCQSFAQLRRNKSFDKIMLIQLGGLLCGIVVAYPIIQ